VKDAVSLTDSVKLSKGTIMRALQRLSLAAPVIAVSILSAGTPAMAATSASDHFSAVVAVLHSTRPISADCPAGSNWDNTTQQCD
jgi:hypothetical protein